MNPDAAAAAKTRRGRLAAITNDFATALQTRPRQRGREGDPGKIDYIEQNNSRSKLGIGGKQETSVQHTVGTRQNRSTDSLGVTKCRFVAAAAAAFLTICLSLARSMVAL